MLAEKAEEPSDDKDWLNELKLDGVRCIAYLDSDTKLQGRSGAIITHKFPELHQLHKQVNKPCIVDSEVACANFPDMMKRIHKEKAFDIKMAMKLYPAHLHAFTVLYIDDKSFMGEIEIARKDILGSVLTDSEVASVLPYEIGNGVALFRKTKDEKKEGIMSKRLTGTYVPGKRVAWWKKIKHWRDEPFYVCGLTEGSGDRLDTFGSLILGELREDKWVHVGNCGTGFDRRMREILLAVFSHLKWECPFYDPPRDKPVKFWCKPAVQVEVVYFELGPDGKLRFPVFKRIVVEEG